MTPGAPEDPAPSVPARTLVPGRARRRSAVGISGIVAIGILVSACPLTAAHGESHDPPGFRLTRSDAWFAAASIGAIAIAATSDRHVADEAARYGGQSSQDLADAVRPLGTPLVLGSALVVTYGVGRLTGHPNVESASVRMLGAVVASGIVTQGLKLAVGRARPEDAPGDPHHFQPFSGDQSFPSGHTTLAFAAATALDRETSTRWAWTAYPIAALVGWSRLRDEAHWMSDVVGGAVVGTWVASKTDDYLRARAARAARAGAPVGVIAVPGPGGPMLGARLRF